MVALAVIVYFLVAEWYPCHRGRQALIICVLFNLWTILPLGPAVSPGSNTTNVSIPFWQPPPSLLHGTTTARGLLSASCVSFPGLILKAKLLPEGMRDFVPLPVRLILSLILLLVKLSVVLFLLLPLNTILLVVCVSGVIIAYSTIWVMRSIGWLSAMLILVCMHIVSMLLSGLRRLCDYIQSLTQQRLSATPPTVTFPPPSFHDIRALHALVISRNDPTHSGAIDSQSVAFFTSLSDLVSSMASLAIQLLNERALSSQGNHGVVFEFTISSMTRQCCCLVLFAHCLFSLWEIFQDPSSSSATTVFNNNDITSTRTIAQRKSKKERRRRVIEDSDDEDDA